jgi:putative transposase
LANLIKEIYLESDCRYGYRKITKELHHQHYDFNHKKVLKIMREIGIQGLYPRRSINTTIINKEHSIYPYLLNGLIINKPNQVWATDLTYINIQGKFMYFMAIIDVYSRYIIAYDLSSSLEASFCVNLLSKALNSSPIHK